MRVMAVPSTTEGAATSAQRNRGIPALRQLYQLARKPPIIPPYATSPPSQILNTSRKLSNSLYWTMLYSTRAPTIDQTAVHM